MWGENWVLSFWLWGVWICMMAVRFSSSQVWCCATTLPLNTLPVTGIYHCACVPVSLCVCASEKAGELLRTAKINNLAEHFSTGLRVCASLIGSQSVYQKRVSECFTGTRKQSWIEAYNFRTMPMEKCFSCVVIQLCTDRSISPL